MSSFLSRWAQRKAEITRQEAASPEPPAAEAPAIPPVYSDDNPLGLAEEELSARLAVLPPLDEITASTDLRPFLQDFVPKALKNAAMRRVWLLDPVISTHLDVARDYAWDFNSGPGPEGFYSGLSKDLIERSMAALKAVAAPEESVAPDDPAEVEVAPSGASTTLAEGEAADPTEKPTLRQNVTLRHGGALPS